MTVLLILSVMGAYKFQHNEVQPFMYGQTCTRHTDQFVSNYKLRAESYSYLISEECCQIIREINIHGKHSRKIASQANTLYSAETTAGSL